MITIKQMQAAARWDTGMIKRKDQKKTCCDPSPNMHCGSMEKAVTFDLDP